MMISVCTKKKAQNVAMVFNYHMPLTNVSKDLEGDEINQTWKYYQQHMINCHMSLTLPTVKRYVNGVGDKAKNITLQ